MRRHVPEDVESALARLAQRVDSLGHDLADLATVRPVIESHGRAIAHLSELITAGGPAGGSGEGLDHGEDDETDCHAAPAPEWLTVTDPAQAIAWLAGLTRWVPRVWSRYPSSRMTACWPWHPAIVAELLVSQYLWADAAAPGNGADRLAAWHDRWRPAAAVRITRSLSGCERGSGCHVNPAGHHFTYDPAYLDELAEWWALNDLHDLDAAPGLTRELRHDHDRREIRR